MSDFDGIDAVIDEDAYRWMMCHPLGVKFIAEIERVVARGVTPDNLHHYILSAAGPDRAAFALRCKQVARHIQRTEQ